MHARSLSLLLMGLLVLATLPLTAASGALPEADGKLRIVVFGAHPDDAELDAGGVAARWARLGHHVKFVSMTNGDIGHATQAGGPLAARRLAEVLKADQVLGVESVEVYDIHDGELMPTLENRRKVVRSIREWKADIVLSHRPNDYHPDHRYTGVLVQDAAFMVIVKHFLPTVPALTRNPVFLYTEDSFQKPQPFEPDIVVSIDEVMEQKIEAIWQLESQIESLWATGNFEEVVPVPAAGPERDRRKAQVGERFKERAAAVADRYRDQLVQRYGADLGNRIRYAEAFERCEYGRRPRDEEWPVLFPFFPE